MSGQYPNYPGYSPYYNVETGQPIVSQEGYVNPYQPYQSVSSEQLHAAYVDFKDPDGATMSAQASNRGRRKSAPGADHVKHRRTRSGCFTCRNRRVKCDENHPICERCRKGNRECVYPEPTSSTKSKGPKSKASPESGESQDDLDLEGIGDGKEPLPSIPDDEDQEDVDPSDMGTQSVSQIQSASVSHREPSSTPSLTMDKSPSPSTEGSVSVPPQPLPSRPVPSRRGSRQSLSKPAPARSLNDLPPQLRFYLEYHRTHLTCHHYALKHDENNWISTTFLQIAVRNPPLLYAVVGFAAYHHTLSRPNGRIQDFLEYYNQSVTLLRKSIERKQKHNVATLLTILQLACIEEVLGDWVNLRGHQKAASELMTTLYTPQSMNETETLRKTLQWYVRFDLFVGLQAGSESTISREWFEETHKYWVQQIQENPDSLGAKYQERFSYSRWMATDMALLFGRKSKGQISDEMFGAEIAVLAQKFDEWESNIDPAMTNPDYLVKDFSDWPPTDPDSIVDPRDPTTLYGGDLWTSNFIFVDFWAVRLLFKSLLSLIGGKPPSPDCVELAYKSAKVFAAIELYPQKPAGSIIDAQASFAMGTLYMSRDEKTSMWCRKKLALIESSGYLYPLTLRNRMQEAWNVDLSEWWLPDLSTCPPMIRKLRNFAQECSTAPTDQTSEDLHAMRGIFSSLSLDDSESPRDKGKGMTPSSDETRDFDWPPGSPGGSVNWEQTPPDFKWDYHQDIA